MAATSRRPTGRRPAPWAPWCAREGGHALVAPLPRRSFKWESRAVGPCRAPPHPVHPAAFPCLQFERLAALPALRVLELSYAGPGGGDGRGCTDLGSGAVGSDRRPHAGRRSHGSRTPPARAPGSKP
jgi:hypothetical protein